MTVAELIEVLKTKEQTTQVEYIIVQTDGLLVAAKIEEKAKDLTKLLKMFA